MKSASTNTETARDRNRSESLIGTAAADHHQSADVFQRSKWYARHDDTVWSALQGVENAHFNMTAHENDMRKTVGIEIRKILTKNINARGVKCMMP